MSQEITPAAIAAYLQENPNFLLENPQLLKPRKDEKIVDLQQVLVGKLREESLRLNEMTAQLIELSRNNLDVQERTHNAVLALLEATSGEEFISILKEKVPAILEIDIILLCIENFDKEGILCLETGAVARFMGKEVSKLRDQAGRDFFPNLPEIASDAYMRIPATAKHQEGVLMLGSKKLGTFHPDQATHLLAFVGRVVGLGLERWL